MVNKIGNYLCLLFLFLAIPLWGEVRLKFTDMNGIPIKQAAIGVPFILEVIAISSSKTIQPPSVQGIEALQPKQIGFQLRSSGTGQSEVVYKFRLQANESGSYDIGPVLSKAGVPLNSGSIKLIVANDSVCQTTQKKQTVKPEPFFRLMSNKNNPIVGEKVIITGRFYFVNDALSLNSVTEPTAQTLTRFSTSGPKQGEEEVSSTVYQFIEWQWECACQEVGRLVVPACVADFEIYKHQQQFQLGGFIRFLGPQVEQQRVYSNAIVFNVEPLPPHEKEIAFIGTLKNINASTSPSVAKEGEGMVFTISLEGDGVSSMKTPKLVNIPSSFKYYESKAITKPSQYPYSSERHFEYIFQGLKPGDWTIPAQEFTYFDSEQKTFKTVQTAPVVVSIIAGGATKQIDEITPPTSNKETNTQALPLLRFYKKPSHEKKISWWLFIIFLLIPLFYLGYIVLKKWWFGNIFSQAYLTQNAFGLARKELKREYALSATHINTTLKQCFAYRFNVSVHEVTAEFMNGKLREAGLSEKQCNEWNAFTLLLDQQQFGKEGKNSISSSLLKKQATEWLDQLEVRL